MTLQDYVNDAIASFAHDPADNDFQRGYLAALKWVQNRIEEECENVDRPSCLH